MSLTKEEILAFVEENVVLEKVNGKIVINVIRTDVEIVDGYVDRAASAGRVHGHVGKVGSAGRVTGRVSRAGSVGWVDGHVGKAASVSWVGSLDRGVSVGSVIGWVSNEESES